MENVFKLGAKADKKTSSILFVCGLFFFLFIWFLITSVLNLITPMILPSPQSVFFSFFELKDNFQLFANCKYSILLNLKGYLEAVCISIPLGFLIGWNDYTKALLSNYVNSARFLPLTALTGLFIAYFGLGLSMKIHFLSFGIIIYLVPVIVQRIDEIEKVHLQTIYTLNANSWQKLRHVYFPSVLSRISDDIRVLVAISWTYIIVAELINKEGGIGAMIFNSGKQGRMDWVYCLLICIIIIGILQDFLFKLADKFIFPYKYDKNLRQTILKLIINPKPKKV